MRPDLASLRSALTALVELLDRERQALAAFDLDVVGAIAADKERLLSSLRDLVPAVRDAQVHPDTPDDLRALTFRVQQRSRANLVLLDYARKAVATRLGLSDEAATYDARARTRRASAHRHARGY